MVNKPKFGDISNYVKAAQAGKHSDQDLEDKTEEIDIPKAGTENSKEPEVDKTAAEKNRNRKSNEVLNHLMLKSIKKNSRDQLGL